MEENPQAPAEAPKAPESEATPNTNETATTAPAAPDMHGFTSEQLADMQKFFQANGGYDKVKSRISNPTPAPAEEQKPVEPVQPAKPQEGTQASAFNAPSGATKMTEYAVRGYFKELASEEKYAGIAKDLVSGDILKEMSSLGIHAVYPDGSIDEEVLFKFLDLKAQTVPAKQTSEMPEASAAPTVEYVPVGEKIENMRQAQQILAQDSMLKRQGQAGHPAAAKAEEYLKSILSPEKK